MRQAASSDDFVTAGELRKKVRLLEDLARRIKAAAAEDDYVVAGELHSQYLTLTGVEPKSRNSRDGDVDMHTSDDHMSSEHESVKSSSMTDVANESESERLSAGESNLSGKKKSFHCGRRRSSIDMMREGLGKLSKEIYKPSFFGSSKDENSSCSLGSLGFSEDSCVASPTLVTRCFLSTN